MHTSTVAVHTHYAHVTTCVLSCVLHNRSLYSLWITSPQLAAWHKPATCRLYSVPIAVIAATASRTHHLPPPHCAPPQVINRESKAAGILALTLTESLEVTAFLKYAVRAAAMFESRFNSVERLLAYVNLLQEAPAHVPDHTYAMACCVGWPLLRRLLIPLWWWSRRLCKHRCVAVSHLCKHRCVAVSHLCNHRLATRCSMTRLLYFLPQPSPCLKSYTPPQPPRHVARRGGD